MKHFRPIALSVAVIAFSVALLISVFDFLDSTSTEPKTPDIEIVVTQAVEPERPPSPVRVHYIVKVGDTLSKIFTSWDIPYRDVQRVLEADLNHLQLDTIRPGDHLELVLDGETRALSKVIYHISLVERAIYTLEEDNQFSYEFEEEEGQWKSKLYSGTINGSFSLSAYKLGLSPNQIANITELLRDKIDFGKVLRAGDRFNVLVSEQFLGDHPTGNSEIQGISFDLRSREVAAFLAEDGRFYDRDGNSLQRAFNRYPVDKQYRRITSAFNPKRKHPVTGRVTPHNGTDFATPVGAPIYSTGDGKVIGVRNHPYAGKYLVIEHNNVYKTRYLHLSKFLVKKGQYVTRGQKIALSGATGRLTGPHLHFEVLVRNRAVDPMKADLPLASSLSQKDKASFLARIDGFDMLVSQETGV